ncbi:polysaccharide export protein [Natroniella acetigena]|uniref:SLBB domain-containing protein n=1 Tax=Natroniella acetigena TaxID=52004 RepID=UPI00200A091C|nr:polysaccharide biosynthesis/export family protein [Natroniella acetigena]MCK8827544.1 polysaccharide export protein [Natroniella acetigena]
MKRLLLYSVIIAILLPVVVSQPVGAEENYRLAVDDLVAVSVWGHNDLQREVRVDPDGKISLPLIGKLAAEGLTVEELTEIVTDKLSQYINLKEGQVSINLLEYQRHQVMILGEVRNPGTYQIRAGKTVLDIISEAGGATEIADLAQVNLNRTSQAESLDLEAMLAGEKFDQNPVLEDGDIIKIPQNVIRVTILGEISQSGSYQLEEGLRLSDLLAKAGGVTQNANKRLEYISAGEREELDVDQILADDEFNPVLADGDTIHISRRRIDWERIFFYVGGFNAIRNLLDI